MCRCETPRAITRIVPFRYQLSLPERQVIDAMRHASVARRWVVVRMVNRYFELYPLFSENSSCDEASVEYRQIPEAPQLRLVLQRHRQWPESAGQ